MKSSESQDFCRVTLLYGAGMSVIALGVGSFCSDVKYGAVSVGALYMFISLRVLLASCGSDVSESRKRFLLFTFALFKLPLLALLLYGLALAGREYIYSALAGFFCFAPAAVVMTLLTPQGRNGVDVQGRVDDAEELNR